ncbi:MAG: GTPase ObgE [Mariprofundaceae bacterium]|nr:GTPase ObgE [Mariprofundaceae bacterium]
MRFIDEVKIEVRAGNGGPGCSSMRREKYIPKGGPDGGDGGRGGHVILVASHDKNTLQELYLRKRIVAKNGHSGKGKKMHGRMGEDVYVKVPLGTVVKDEHGEILFDLTRDGQEAFLARGGKGGLGNPHFVTSTNRAPRYAQPGTEGESGIRFLELKSMADVGLVGLPNAGKSTLISRVSNARPKIADYPFTTIAPSLGQVYMDDGDGFVMADIPGLIEGAHEGRGLGHRFLKHIERTRVLLHLVDVAHPEGVSITDQFNEIEAELKGYGESVCNKPRLLVLNKMDAVPDDQREQLFEEAAKLGLTYYAVSSLTGEGIQPLLRDLYDKVRAVHAEEFTDEAGADGAEERTDVAEEAGAED